MDITSYSTKKQPQGQNINHANEWLKERHSQWVAGLPPFAQLFDVHNVPTMISIGGGKGGVGKSFISANLAAKLGSLGFKVLLVDLDLGGANLHTYLGMGSNKLSLADFVLYEQKSFAEVIQPSSANNVDIVSGGKDESWALEGEGNTTGSLALLWESILGAKRNFGYDFVVLDLGAGIHRHTVDFFQSSHLGILSVLPEPTSIENAYTFLKACMSRLIENVGTNKEEFEAAYKTKELLTNPDRSRGVSYAQRIKSMYQEYPHFVEELFYALSGRQLGIVINQVHSQRDVDIGLSMNQICQNFFAFQSVFLGFLNHDDAARKALRNKSLLINDFPHAILTKRIGSVVNQLQKCLGY